jgi:hypothetical protein
MSEQQLRALIDNASMFAEQVIAARGEVAPIWHMITSDGEEMIELTPPVHDKDTAIGLIRALMAMANVVRYIHLCEAWMLDDRKNRRYSDAEIRKIAEEGLSEHPDRMEVVIFQAEDHEAGMISGHRRIIRNKGDHPRLGPLELLPRGTESEGRFVGLLPKPKGSTLQ